MSDDPQDTTPESEEIQVTVVNVGNPRTITVPAGTSVADALSEAGVDPNSAIRFRGETIGTEEAVSLILSPGEVVQAGPPRLSHGVGRDALNDRTIDRFRRISTGC